MNTYYINDKENEIWEYDRNCICYKLFAQKKNSNWTKEIPHWSRNEKPNDIKPVTVKMLSIDTDLMLLIM